MPYLYKYKYILLENGVKKRKPKYNVRKFKDRGRRREPRPKGRFLEGPEKQFKFTSGLCQ